MAVSLIGCGSKNMSFDLLSESASFSQSSAEINGKIDILWVIDNSGSMASSQTNIANNFRSFIQKFEENGYDFQIAVATSDAFRDLYTTGSRSKYARGVYQDDLGNNVTAPAILLPTTPDLEKAFMANVKRGTSGSGDERTFQSMATALDNTDNKALGFPRADAFLSVIMVTDEDDFSWSGSTDIDWQYDNPNIHTPQMYVDFMDTLTASTSTNRSYNINTIAIFDEACRQQAMGGTPNNYHRIAIRHRDLSDLTGGLKASICDNFATSLDSISNRIIELSTQFYLDRVPRPGSLRVYVNLVEIPQNGANGFTYNSTNNSITFHGTGVPVAGAQISVSYDPIELR
jgi:hypothetical protein